jgi:hypothetical protein
VSEGSERVVFSATITPQGVIHPDAVNATAGRLARWGKRHVTVTVSRYVKPKSNPQLGLYFMEGGILECWAEFCGYDRDEMHRELKRAYLAPRLAVSKLTGEEVKELPSLADLNVEEMSEFMERVLREGRQHGIRFNVEPNA